MFPELAEADRDPDIRVLVAAPGFEQQDPYRRIRAEAVRQDAPRGSRADDDVVVSRRCYRGTKTFVAGSKPPVSTPFARIRSAILRTSLPSMRVDVGPFANAATRAASSFV